MGEDAMRALKKAGSALRREIIAFRSDLALDQDIAPAHALDVESTRRKMLDSIALHDPRRAVSLEGEYQFACALYRIAHNLELGQDDFRALFNPVNRKHYRQFQLEPLIQFQLHKHDSFHHHPSALLPENEVKRFTTPEEKAALREGYTQRFTALETAIDALQTVLEISPVEERLGRLSEVFAPEARYSAHSRVHPFSSLKHGRG